MYVLLDSSKNINLNTIPHSLCVEVKPDCCKFDLSLVSAIMFISTRNSLRSCCQSKVRKIVTKFFMTDEW